MLSLLIAIGFVFIPRINFLAFILPLDNSEAILALVGAVLANFFAIEIVVKASKHIGALYSKRKGEKYDLQRLQDRINISPNNQQVILLEFLKNNNTPQRYEEHKVRVGHNTTFFFLESLPDSDETRNYGSYNGSQRSVTSYKYRVYPPTYKKISKLYNSKKILLNTNGS